MFGPRAPQSFNPALQQVVYPNAQNPDECQLKFRGHDKEFPLKFYLGLPDFQSRNTGDFFTIAAIGVGAQSTLGVRHFCRKIYA